MVSTERGAASTCHHGNTNTVTASRVKTDGDWKGEWRERERERGGEGGRKEKGWWKE